MHAGIGPAASLNPNRNFAEELEQTLFDDLLNRETIGLPLPSVIRGSVECHHHADDARRKKLLRFHDVHLSAGSG